MTNLAAVLVSVAILVHAAVTMMVGVSGIGRYRTANPPDPRAVNASTRELVVAYRFDTRTGTLWGAVPSVTEKEELSEAGFSEEEIREWLSRTRPLVWQQISD